MNKYAALLHGKIFFLLIPILVVMAYLGGTVFSSSKIQKDTGLVTVKNSTRFCNLLNVQKHKDKVEFLFQNNNSKAATAYVLRSWINPTTVFTYKEEYLFSEGDDVILPGKTYNRVIGIHPDPSGQFEVNLTLSAVLYEDNSYEGDADVVREVIDNRLGQKTELMKVIPVIEKLSSLSEAELSDYWVKNAKQDVETALERPDAQSPAQLRKKPLDDDPANESEEFKLGVQAGKDYINQKYQELTDIQEKAGALALRQAILQLRDVSKKMISRF